jgi:hypothetical protein
MNSVRDEVRARAWLVAGAGGSFAGVLVAGTVHRTLGGWLTLIGWVLALVGLHTFGRLGRAAPAPALDLASKDEHADLGAELGGADGRPAEGAIGEDEGA